MAIGVNVAKNTVGSLYVLGLECFAIFSGISTFGLFSLALIPILVYSSC